VGYWARIKHGHTEVRIPLPDIADSGLEIIYMQRKDPSTAQPGAVSELDRIMAFERNESNRIAVPKQLTDPHPPSTTGDSFLV
jgi:hypothetical protein